MPGEREKRALPSPWLEFLTEADAALRERVSLHCIGGFVACYFYGLARSTGDIDYFASVPAKVDLEGVAGEGSALAKRYKVCLHRASVATLPADYEARLTEMAPGQFRNLRLFVPDPYDLILSKLDRNSSKDRDDGDFLFKKLKLSGQELRERYEKELRPYLANEERHDLTLKLWIEIFESS